MEYKVIDESTGEVALDSPISKAEAALAIASTPQQSKQVEALAAAAKAWAKEQGDYENVVEAARIYILAKQKTTELIEPNINQGRPVKGNVVVTFLEDYGFTKMQWQRRKKLLDITTDDIDYYINDCIEKTVEPTVYGLFRYLSDPHVTQNTGENEWYTPADIIEKAREVMGVIDLDPASSDKANETVKATTYYTIDDNGLEKTWYGHVWMNPPYSQPDINHFSNKLTEQLPNIIEAIVLVNNATETNWYQNMLNKCDAVCFIKGRVRFVDVNGKPSGAPLQGQTLLYFGTKVSVFNSIFADNGIILHG